MAMPCTSYTAVAAELISNASCEWNETSSLTAKIALYDSFQKKKDYYRLAKPQYLILE